MLLRLDRRQFFNAVHQLKYKKGRYVYMSVKTVLDGVAELYASDTGEHQNVFVIPAEICATPDAEEVDALRICDKCDKQHTNEFEAAADLTYCEKCNMQVCGKCFCNCSPGTSKCSVTHTHFAGDGCDGKTHFVGGDCPGGHCDAD